MKTHQIFSIILCFLFSHQSLTQTDEINFQKYWKFRNAFRQNFVKIGNEEGESIPAIMRLPEKCKNNIDDTGSKGTIRWGDGMIMQGHYIGFLATEYKLLKDRSKDATSTLNELYYALNAINRSDEGAEYIISSIVENNLPVIKDPNLNGFYLRDDIPSDMYLNWETSKINCRCTEGDRYYTNNAAHLNDGADIAKYRTNDHSTPSLDQMTSLLVGLKMCDILITEDLYVQPTVSDPVMNIRNEVKQITNRLISYAYNHNWLLLDEWGWPVGNGGGDLAFTAYPITLIGNAITGNDYSSTITRETPIEYEFARSFWCQPEEDRLEELLTYDIEQQYDVLRFECDGCNWENSVDGSGTSRYEAYNMVDGAEEFSTTTSATFWMSLIPERMDEFYTDWSEDFRFNETVGGVFGLLEWKSINWTDYNNNIIFNLGVASGLFNSENTYEWANATENYQMPLILSVLTGNTPYGHDREFFRDLLNTMPIYGGFKFRGSTWTPPEDDIEPTQTIWSNGWGGEYKWNDALEADSGTGFEGQPSGLDYLYLHNLYYLVYGDEIEQEYEENYECLCDDSWAAIDALPVGEIPQQNLTLDELIAAETNIHPAAKNKLAYLDFCVQNDFENYPTNELDETFDLKQLFEEYHYIGISLNKYQTNEFTVLDGGVLNIESRLVVCNTKQLTVNNGGQINLDKGEILIKPGAKLIIEGNVTIDPNTKVIVEDGGEIIIKTGGTLANSGYIQLKEGAKMIYEEDATFKMQDDFAELHFDGGDLILKPNAAFTFEKGASQSGQLRFSEWGEHVFTEGNNAIILTGNGDDDPIVVIDQDADFWADPSGLSWMTVTSGEIVLDSNARMVCIPEFTANNIHFVGEDLNRGLVAFDETNISNAVFDQVPIYAALHYRNTGTFNMTLSEVNDNTDGIMVKIKGKGYSISQTDFNGEATYMVSAQNITEYSRISNSTFNGTLSTVGVIDNSNGTVEIKSCDFNTLYAGVHKLDGKAILRCNDFTDFKRAAAIAHNNCILDLSSNGQGGYNTFDKNDPAFGKNIALWNAQGILLNKGYNFFDEAGTLPIIEGTMQVSPPDGVIPMVMANANRWNVADVAPIPAEDFEVTSSTIPDLTINFSTTTTEDGPCPLNDDDLISGLSGIVPNYQDGEATLNSLNFNQVSLSEALNTCIEATNTFDDTKNDVDALALFEEVLVNYADYDTSRRNEVLARYGANMMKQTLQHAFSTDEITLSDNVGSFAPGVQSYVNVLNAMTAVPFNNYNYEQLFYLEMDKAHLFQLLGKTDVALYLLLNAESCGLDSLEQAHLNHWKQEWDEEIRMKDYGYVAAEFKDTVWMDTSYYNVPVNQVHGEFGSEIVDINTVNYFTCGQQRIQMKDESDHQILPLMVYPNPNTGVFQIEYTLPANSTGMMVVHDASGKEVYRFNCYEGNHVKTVDVNGIESGTYFYSFYINEVLEKTGQVVVK